MKVWPSALFFLAAVAVAVPLAAQSYSAFGPRPATDIAVPVFADRDVTSLVGTLDRLLSATPAGPA